MRARELEAALEAADQRIKDFEIRQVLYFIEIERLYLINGEFLEHIATLDATCSRLAAELDGARGSTAVC